MVHPPGTRVRINGLVSAAEYNGKDGFVVGDNIKKAPKGRLAVCLFDRNPGESNKFLSIKEVNVEVVAPPVTAGHTALYGLPPLRDECELSFLIARAYDESALEKFRRLSERADTPEDAERAVFIEMHGGNVYYEMHAFPTLFFSGSGYFAMERRTPVRYDEFINWALRQYSGVFLKDDLWVQESMFHAAILRQVTGRQPAFQSSGDGRALNPSTLARVERFMEADPQKAWHLRFLVGDEEFCGLVSTFPFLSEPE